MEKEKEIERRQRLRRVTGLPVLGSDGGQKVVIARNSGLVTVIGDVC